MKLSIIVPVYNMAADGKLEYCLNSLVRQTADDYEIIAVDDASTDESFAVLKRYENQYPELLRVFRLEKNHRQGGAKNKGLDEAAGEYIGFVDSDDWVHPDMYARLMERAQETGADIVGCDYCLTKSHTMEPGDSCHNNFTGQCGILDEEKYKSLILNPGSLVIKIFSRQLFEAPRLRFPEHIFYEDNAVATALMLRAKHFEYIDEPYYYYYQHSSSTVHTISEQKCNDRMQAMEYMLSEARKDGGLERFQKEIEYRFFCLFYKNTLFSYMQGMKHYRLAYIRRMGKEMRESFPNFQKNEYYLDKTDAECKRMIALQQKSTVLFVLYYRLLYLYRNIKYKNNR